MARIDVFVYGTLRPGGRFHDRFCAGVRTIEAAIVCGRVRRLPAGYPMLTVRAEQVLARGGADPLGDARVQAEWRSRGDLTIAGTDDAVEGDLLGFDDPETRLPRLDDLEGFRASGGGLYDRVLVAVRETRTSRVVPAWVYVEPFDPTG